MRAWIRPLLATLLSVSLLAPAVFQNGTPAVAQPGTPNNALIEGAALGSAPRVRSFGLDTNVGLTLTTQGAGDITLTPAGAGIINLNGPVTLASTITQSAPVTNTLVVTALGNCHSSNALLIPTRIAANDWAMARTAAGAETYNITCQIPLPFRNTASKGVRLNSFAIAQQITVAALTSNTFNALATVTYANNVANAIAGYGGVVTITPPTATQANPYLTAGTLGTPAFMTTTNAAVNMDFTVVMQNTGVYRLYAVALTYDTVSF
jgi:hypothetical protein